jgi:hypothetical protein
MKVWQFYHNSAGERYISSRLSSQTPRNREGQIDRTGMATMSSTAGTSRIMNGSP